MKPSDTLRALFLVCLVLTRPAAFAHSATEPVPRGEASGQERHKLLNQRAAEAGEKAQVIFIGDSITQGWEGEGRQFANMPWKNWTSPEIRNCFEIATWIIL